MPAKSVLLSPVSFVNKRVSEIDFHAARDGNLALIEAGFSTALSQNGGAYPATPLAARRPRRWDG